MLKIENTEVMGWEHAIRGMRNPMNSWEKSDSKRCYDMDICDTCSASGKTVYRNPQYKHGGTYEIPPVVVKPDPDCHKYYHPFIVGENDHQLMKNLAHGGPVHAKYRRMITVYMDITAPFYWWKEFDTYKVGTVANSCSTMHKIHEKEFTQADFSHEHLLFAEPIPGRDYSALGMLDATIKNLNMFRELYLETHDKKYWWQMIQLLPTSYNQKRTVMLNYEVLANIYESRRHHKLDEWKELCKWIETLPYSELITGELECENDGEN